MAPNVLKSEENLSWDFTFSVKMRLCRYLKGFFTYKKILNNIFLNSLFPIPKIIDMFYIVPAEKPDLKKHNETHKNRFGPH